MIGINLYDKIKLKTGETAVVAEILRNESYVGYIVDIDEGNFEYRTETVFAADIESVFVEIEVPLQDAV